MSAAKIIGGILALFGGGFIVLQIIGFWPSFFIGDPDSLYCFLTNTVTAGLAIVGGIIGRLGKRAGGILAVIAGVLAIVLGLITVYYTNNESVWPLSFFTSTYHWFAPPYHIFAGITVESLLIVSGGVIIVASGSK